MLCPQAHNNLLPGSVSSQVDYYTWKVTAVVSMTLTAADIQGADPYEPLALFGIAIQNFHGKHSQQRRSAGSRSSQTRYTISLSYLDHLEIGGRRRPDSSSGCCHNSLRYEQAYRVVLDRTSTDSHSSHTVVNVQVTCLSLWSLKLGNRYSCSHARVSKRPPADLAIHHNTLRAAKEQPDVTSYIHTYFRLRATGLFLSCSVLPLHYGDLAV